MSTHPTPASEAKLEVAKPQMVVRLASLDQPGPLSGVNAINNEPLITVGTPEWVTVTLHREALIRKEFSPDGLTGDEAAELERLEALSQKAIQQAFPSPFTDDLEALERVAGAARRGHTE